MEQLQNEQQHHTTIVSPRLHFLKYESKCNRSYCYAKKCKYVVGYSVI